MRARIFTVLCLLAGCAPVEYLPMVEEAPPAKQGMLPAGQQKASFPTYPQGLLDAALAACDNPGQTPRRPAPDTVICETLPTPDAAAALILRFDGTVDALPLFVISFQARPQGTAYIVTADSYVTVPQLDGTIRQVRLVDSGVGSSMTGLLTAAGGTPVQNAPGRTP